MNRANQSADRYKDQVAQLERILARNPVVAAIFERVPAFALPDWYLGAGGITHTVWNHLHDFALTRDIKDYDLVYYDSDDLSASAEDERASEVMASFSDLGVKIDVTNEARVHLWYERRFGFAIAPYRSTEHAIPTWPTTASSVGVRYDVNAFIVCAPFGLDDLFSMVVRPNKRLIDEAVYEAKVQRWSQQWPRLTVVSWNDEPSQTGGSSTSP